MTTTTDIARARLAAGLEEAARLLREHPDLPRPYITAHSQARVSWYLELDHHGLTPDEQAAEFLRIALSRGSMGDWTRSTAPEGCKGWERHDGHLRLIVTYRLAEASS